MSYGLVEGITISEQSAAFIFTVDNPADGSSVFL
jgi:hypothetical protein